MTTSTRPDWLADIVARMAAAATPGGIAGCSSDEIAALEFPANAFFIRGRYGEQFEFIVCDGGDDASVHYWNRDDDAPVEVFPSIRAWLEAICADALS